MRYSPHSQFSSTEQDLGEVSPASACIALVELSVFSEAPGVSVPSILGEAGWTFPLGS